MLMTAMRFIEFCLDFRLKGTGSNRCALLTMEYAGVGSFRERDALTSGSRSIEKKQKCPFLNSSGENHGLALALEYRNAPCSSSSAVTWNPAEDFFASNDVTPSPLCGQFSI